MDRDSGRGDRGGRAAIRSRLVAAVFCLVAGPTHAAAHFSNSYVAFDLPDGWACKLEETEFVCEPADEAHGKRAMIVILTAKEVGKDDSPQLYRQELETIGQRSGVVVDQPPKDSLIGRSLWIDASLWNSEVPDFKTRYLARTEGDVGVLVTFSAHRSMAAQAAAISDLIAASIILHSEFVRPEVRQHDLLH